MRRFRLLIALFASTLLLAGCGMARPLKTGPAPAQVEAGSSAGSPADATPQAPAPNEPGAVRVVASGLLRPDGIAIDSRGTMYVGSRSDNSVVKVTPDGSITPFVVLEGTETLCMTVDSADNLYVATEDRVWRVTPEGEATLLADGFQGADDLRFDPDGNLFVTDAFVARVYKIAPDGSKSVWLDLNRPMRPRTWYFTGLTFAADYRALYLTNMVERQILKVPVNIDGSAGSPVTVADKLPSPDHLAADVDGNLYASMYDGAEVVRIAPDGAKTVLSGPGAKLGTPTGLVFGRGPVWDENSLYIADESGGLVLEVLVGKAGAR